MLFYNQNKLKIYISTLLIIAFSLSFNFSFAQDGEALYKANCANCHKPDKDFTGPALQGWSDRAPDAEWIYKWIANPAGMVASGDAYSKALFDKWKPTMMTGFPQLSKEEVDAIMKYVDDYQPPGAVGTGTAVAVQDDTSKNTLLYGILTLVLAVVAFVLYQVNRNLRRVADEKEGILRADPIPVYRNKTFIMLGILLLFLAGGYWTIEGAIGLGRQQNYKPKQPIFFPTKYMQALTR